MSQELESSLVPSVLRIVSGPIVTTNRKKEITYDEEWMKALCINVFISIPQGLLFISLAWRCQDFPMVSLKSYHYTGSRLNAANNKLETISHYSVHVLSKYSLCAVYSACVEISRWLSARSKHTDGLLCGRSTLHSHANCRVCGQKVCDLMELFLKMCVWLHLNCGVVSMCDMSLMYHFKFTTNCDE